MSRPVCLITGGTSGIGRCTALEMRAAGYTVYELSRRETGVEGLHHIPTDVTDEEAVQRAVEFTDTKDAVRQLDVNFFGMVRVNHAVLPVLRKQGSGRIVNLSSVAGAIPIPFQTYYSASKAAINSYTMALANEVRPFGITVCAVQPGDIKTGFTAARQKTQAGDDVYAGRISRSVAGMERDEQTGMQPEAAGRFIRRVAMKTGRKPIYTIGGKYKFFCMLAKLLPKPALNWLVGLLYAK